MHRIQNVINNGLKWDIVGQSRAEGIDQQRLDDDSCQSTAPLRVVLGYRSQLLSQRGGGGIGLPGIHRRRRVSRWSRTRLVCRLAQ